MAVFDPLNACRLCLIDNNVDIPIFEEDGDLNQIFLKISACLPVNVTLEDKLSHKICHGCLDKVEAFYEYWNSTADAEKTLLRYLESIEQFDNENFDYYKQSNEETEQDVESIEEKEMSSIEENFGEYYVVHQNDETIREIKVEPELITNEQVSKTARISNKNNSIPTIPQDKLSNVEAESPSKKSKTKNLSKKNIIIKNFPITRKLVQISPKIAFKRDYIPTPKQQKFSNPPEFVMIQEPISTKSGSKIFLLSQSNMTASPQGCISDSSLDVIDSNDNQKFDSHEIDNQELDATDSNDNQEVDIPEEIDENIVKKRKKIKTLRTNGPYKCEYCDLIFQYQREVRAHIKAAHLTSDPKLKCNECNLEFKTRQTLSYHFMRKHTTDNQYICHECGKQFKMKHGLYMHIQASHKKDDEGICQFCNRVCRNKFALKQHIAALHNIRPYPCSKCKKRLATLESLEAHEKLHDRQIQVECDVCKKIFTSTKTLKNHMTIHTGIRPYICKVCGKAFRRQHIYKQHLLLHTDAKPYCCDVCGATFKQKPSLITHRKKHGPLPPLPAQSVDNVIKDLLDNVNPESTYYSNVYPVT